MNSRGYTPGHTRNATDFMARRSLKSHGQFFQAYLSPGLSVLDCGCGPGSITLGIAEQVSPGRVVGIDFEISQIERAYENARNSGLSNLEFHQADSASLPFEDNTFDRVFSHALLEHLSNPVSALREFHRVLKPEGIIGVCSPDWGALVLAPWTFEIASALDKYRRLQSRNDGDLGIGRALGDLLKTTGFNRVHSDARFERYPSPELISEYLALQLERDGDSESAGIIRSWCRNKDAMFAQAWISAIALKTVDSDDTRDQDEATEGESNGDCHIAWQVDLFVKPGELENFRALTDEMIASTQNETGVLDYERFISEDGTTVFVFERFENSDAAVAHLRAFLEKYGSRFSSMVQRKNFTVLGTPSEQLRLILDQFNPVYLKPFGGISR